MELKELIDEGVFKLLRLVPVRVLYGLLSKALPVEDMVLPLSCSIEAKEGLNELAATPLLVGGLLGKGAEYLLAL